MCIFCLMTGLLRINITSFSGSCRYGGISKCSNRQGMAKIHLGLTVQRKASLLWSAQLVHIPVTNHRKVGRMHLLKSGRSILLSCMNYTVALTHILDGSIHFLLPLMQIFAHASRIKAYLISSLLHDGLTLWRSSSINILSRPILTRKRYGFWHIPPIN